jgi:hypothetical protein
VVLGAVAPGVVFDDPPPNMADKADPAPFPLLAMGSGNGTVTVFRVN